MKTPFSMGWASALAFALLIGCSETMVTAQPPRLSIQTVANRGVELSWSAPANDLQLESASTLRQSTVWQPVSQAPVLRGGQFVLTVDASQGSRFFRLRQQAGATL
ncbi:MAG: hypothetical protein ABI651_19995, partial [Verrucomicrobiota bacterium]